MKGTLLAATFTIACSSFFSVAYSATGQDTAKDLIGRYYSSPNDCGRNTQPAFLCQGVIFRATVPSPFYDSWAPSPAAQKSGGTSFSYLREDSKFQKLVREENNGYILYPLLKLPAGKSRYQVLCSFPMDGGTDVRDEKGCGKSDQPNSQPCDKQGIYTGTAWADRYKQFNGQNNNTKECGFDVRDALDQHAVKNFNASVDAMGKVGQAAFEKQNELRIETWDPSTPAPELPIQAFFYLPTTGGLDDARYDQQRYFEKTAVRVPIVKMTLPETRRQDATFSYNEWDQAINAFGEPVYRYIKSTEWVSRFDPGTNRKEWSLAVTLTDEGKKQSDSHGSDKVYAELLRKEGRDARWTKPANYDAHRNTMRRQLVCHFQIAENKEPWNLEPFRPYVTAREATQAGCNPL